MLTSRCRRLAPNVSIQCLESTLIFLSLPQVQVLTAQQLADGAPPAEADLRRATTLFRTIKLLRMLKLARVLKASRILQRHLMDLIMGKLEFTFAVLKMIKLVTLLILWSHWQASAKYMRPEERWFLLVPCSKLVPAPYTPQ